MINAILLRHKRTKCKEAEYRCVAKTVNVVCFNISISNSHIDIITYHLRQFENVS